MHFSIRYHYPAVRSAGGSIAMENGQNSGGSVHWSHGTTRPWRFAVTLKKSIHEDRKIRGQKILMQIRTILILCLLVCCTVGLRGYGAEQEATKSSTGKSLWKPLFNGQNLDGWDTVLRESGKNQDPTRVFQVHDNLIHIYKDHVAGAAVPLGYLVSKEDYSHYHLRLEYRWGEKKFPPKMKAARDAGCLYHAANDPVVWPRCVECQIQERDTGDCWVVHGAQLDTTVDPKSGGATPLRFLDAAQGGVVKTVASEKVIRVVKSGNFETDGWNRVEVIVRGADEVEHIVNGHTVFKGRNLRTMATDGKPSEPLTHGRILLQAEFGEVFYRNIEIQPIDSGPLKIE
jgi:hypothetical protein